MNGETKDPVVVRVLTEENQGHATRKQLYKTIEKRLGNPVVSFFTSFVFPVGIENEDADMLEAVLQKMDLSKGVTLLISSPGGDGLAAERIINVLRSYSGTGKFLAVVPGKAKSAATMICFGASEILMAKTSELGPIDPQIITTGGGNVRRFSACNIVESYKDLFTRAVKEKGNLEPYLQQLANYDEREIKELETAIALSEDIAVRTLLSGMLRGNKNGAVKKKIEIFLTPKHTKAHGRPIYIDEAKRCGLKIRQMDVRDDLWKNVYELYIRTNRFVSSRVLKCVESKEFSFVAAVKGDRKDDLR